MKMCQLEVKVDEAGYLLLIQEDGGEDEIIALHPDQVPVVCEWMMKMIGARVETKEVKSQG
ncbi:hypothetical protein WM24_23685 [Burkholderia ubonensis]|uniref:hypothetical protein n=1 Tax=Burkholderia ubonensis TaxID=101571 RepID=UPI0007555383|nr:hypothetical protein [Burkholderia ubonensis]KWN80841.1 hypothetical protein WM24_23685 [Burkholderia ubonensis]